MRPIWEGQITFGLINIPVALYTAQKRSTMHFKLLDERNKARVRYERINEITGEVVPWEHVVKAYEPTKKEYIIMEEGAFKELENKQSFEIEDFIQKNAIDSIYFEKPYYLVPTQKAYKGYALLKDVLTRTQKVAVGKVIIRTRQYLAALLPYEEVLVLNLLRFADEINEASALPLPKTNAKGNKVTDKELQMAEKLVDSMTAKWNPKKYKDTYQEVLTKWIEKKIKKRHITRGPKDKEIKESQTAKVIDFMDLLKKSVKTPKTKVTSKASVPAKKKRRI